MTTTTAEPTSEEFALIAESIPHIVFVARRDGETIYVNRQGTEYTGLPAGADDGCGWLEFVHPEDAPKAAAAWCRATQQVEPYCFEYRIRRFDGTYRWHLVRALPVRWHDGDVGAWIGTATDIHERKANEEELRHTQRRLAESLTLLETWQATAPVGFGFIDRDYRYVRVNDRLAQMNGVDAADHIGRRVADVVPDLWEQIEPGYRAVLGGATIEGEEIEGTTIAEPGRLCSWIVSMYPVRIADEVLGIGLVVTDITERKEAERAQRALLHDVISAIAATVEARDPYTAGHQRRVATIAAMIAAELRLDAEEIEAITVAATVHDIGKVAIPSEVLARPGALRPGDWELVKTHPIDGYEILRSIAFPWPVAQMVLQHHERMDGSGYPYGVTGDDLLLGARIIAVADVLEAMASHRPYRPALGIGVALEELRRGRGVTYDATVVDACMAVVEGGLLSEVCDAS